MSLFGNTEFLIVEDAQAVAAGGIVTVNIQALVEDCCGRSSSHDLFFL